VSAWFKLEKESRENGLGEMALALTKYTDMSHIHHIVRFVLQVAPGILASQHLRPEQDDLLAALAQLANLGPSAPWARMFTRPNDVPELQRSRLPLTSYFAQDLAKRDNPTMENYAKNQTPDFLRSVEALRAEFAATAPAIPRTGMQLIRREYDPDHVTWVVKGLQADLVRARTAIRELRGDDDE